MSFLQKYIYKKRRKGIDYLKKAYSVPLHGACIIFSKLYISTYEQAFHPGTFFYYETELLDYMSLVKNLKTIYEPNIQVKHHQNVSTNIVYKDMKEKTRFANICNYKSTGVLLQYMKENPIKNRN